MSLLEILALCVVVLAGLYMLGLGITSLVLPAQANRFLLGFARSRTAHFVEMSLRLLVGAALIFSAPHMRFSGPFALFGWVLLVSTACLLFAPWRWHQRFAQQAVPRVTRYVALVGLASLAIGGFILVAVARGGGP